MKRVTEEFMRCKNQSNTYDSFSGSIEIQINQNSKEMYCAEIQNFWICGHILKSQCFLH